jgi:hypothetical protein
MVKWGGLETATEVPRERDVDGPKAKGTEDAEGTEA